MSFSERVRQAIDRIRPAVEMDGGELALVDADESTGHVRVQLGGACAGCAASGNTLTLGVERTLKSLVPDVRSVEAI